MYGYALHFAIHALGFDRTQLSKWRHPSNPNLEYAAYDSTTYPYGPVKPWNSESTSIMLPPSTTNLFNPSLVDGDHRVVLITPNVLAAARSHFGCSTLTGIQLEELGPSEMHWERRVMNYELMTTEFNMAPSSLVSSITLAALVDTGWYVLSTNANYGPEPYAWGKGWGCNFVIQECSEATWRHAFCNATFGVAYDRSYVSRCGNTLLYDFYQEPVYQHFSNLTLGGWDPYADYCPYAGNLSVVESCTRARVDDNVGTSFSNITGINTLAVYTTILNQTANTLANRDVFLNEPRCMQFLCLNTSHMLFRAGNAFYGCQGQYPALSELTFQPTTPAATNNGQLSPTAIPAYGFYGQIQCPNVSYSCASGSTLAGLDSTTFPTLVSIQPMNASIAGNVTLAVTWSVGLSVNTAVTCKGLLIGGQQTNSSTWEIGGSTVKSSLYFQSFTINTVPTLSTGAYGGPNDDGSGLVDVSLLCIVPGAIMCGSQYGGYCAVGTWTKAFTFLPPNVSDSGKASVSASPSITFSPFSPPPSSGRGSESGDGSSSNNVGAIVGGIVGGVVGITAIGGVAYFIKGRKEKEEKYPSSSANLGELMMPISSSSDIHTVPPQQNAAHVAVNSERGADMDTAEILL